MARPRRSPPLPPARPGCGSCAHGRPSVWPSRPARPTGSGRRRGVSIAEIDTGVDGTHPFLTEKDGSSAVVANLKSICPHVSLGPECFFDVPGNDSDILAEGGHGTHVAGIIAGRDVRVDGRAMHGAAPGAKIVALSVDVVISIYDVANGLDWVLHNHAKPCGAGVGAAMCPPIKVVSNSWGPAGGGDVDPPDGIGRF